MEHKLIQGGEQYLPFARSRIKAMRASGMQHASQRFLMPGGEEVDVQIVGNQDYIRLSGGAYTIFSGVIRNGDIVNLPLVPPATVPTKTLRDYEPTQQAWEFVLHEDPLKSPTTFHDENRLARTDPTYTNKELCSSMYSGTMTKVVQVILGYAAGVVQVKYDHRWLKCHGVTTGADGRKWLIEISSDDGVRAMRLPLLPATAKLSTSPQDVLKQTVLLLGGLPSGATFPTGTKLADAVAAGNILQLVSVADMAPVFSKSTYSSAMGWSFNDAGTEAHNTCYGVINGVNYGYHYKLNIAIGAVLTEREPNTPIAHFTCTLVEAERGLLLGEKTFAFGDYDFPQSNTDLPVSPWAVGQVGAVSTVVFVCHINNVLERVRHRSARTTDAAGDVVNVDAGGQMLTSNFASSQAWPHALNPLTFVSRTTEYFPNNFDWAESDRYNFPETLDGPSNSTSETQTNLFVWDTVSVPWGGDPPDQGPTTYSYYGWTRHFEIGTWKNSAGMSLAGTRDGYAIKDRVFSPQVIDNSTNYGSGPQGMPPYNGIPMGVATGGPGIAETLEYWNNQTPARPPNWFGVEDFFFSCIEGGDGDINRQFPTPSPSVTTDGPWDITTHLVVSGTVPVTNFTTTFTALGDFNFAHGMWTGLGYGAWAVRHNMFGPNDQLAHALGADEVQMEWDVSGSMLDAQPDGSDDVFSFIGYI